MEIFVKDGVLMLATLHMEKIEIWDISTQSEVKTIFADSIYAIAIFEEDKKSILLGCDRDGTLSMWDLYHYKFIKAKCTDQSGIKSLNTFYLVCTSSYEMEEYVDFGDYVSEPKGLKDICVYDLQNFECIEKIHIHFKSYREINAYSSIGNPGDEQVLLCGRNAHRIEIWNLKSYEHMGFFDECYHSSVFGLFDYNSKSYLAYPRLDNTIIIWDIQSQSKISTLTAGRRRISAIAGFMDYMRIH